MSFRFMGGGEPEDEQILFMSLKCTQAKTFAPPQEKKMKKTKRREKQPRVFRNEGKIEFQDLPFICCSA